jgi:hypothetical protein
MALQQEIKDLESIRKEDEKELKIIRISTSGGFNPNPKGFFFSRNSDSQGKPELSDRRKLYYNAAKAMEKELQGSK